jgi:transketolase
MQRLGTGVGSSLSAVDLLVVLYFQLMKITAPGDPLRDRFILSKGHAAAALYAVLAKRGFFDHGLLGGFLTDGSSLTGHPSRGSLPGIEASTGSLGHGLPIGVGMALAGKREGRSWRVFVMMGDGELQEGAVWEGAQLASRLRLDNLVAIVDVNRLQGYDRIEELTPVAALGDKWRAFGWEVREIDGHDHDQIAGALAAEQVSPGRPLVLLAATVKGKGVKEMEDQLGWHYFSVPADKYASYIAELEENK